MILYGTNITAPNDPLRKISIESLHHAISSPKATSVALIRQLRIVRQFDPKQYSLLKRQLPYFVCGNYTPLYRRGENFASTDRFIIDLDHLADKQIDIPQLRTRLMADSRVEMLFTSPSGDGLKITMRLSEPCLDKGLFSLFYKTFLNRFASEFGLEQVVDSRTSDVTRACFFSYDPEALLNSSPTPVNMSAFVDVNNTLSLFNATTKEPAKPVEKPQSTPVGDNAIENIKAILKLANSRRSRTKAEAYVPEQLNEIMGELSAYIAETGAVVLNIENIQYGKKIQLSISGRRSETNLFYGKRGFSVVVSPKTGTDPEANRLAAELIQSFVNTALVV